MKDGELRFAGYRHTADYPGAQPEGVARAVDWSNPARPKLDNEYVKPKKALIWIAWSNERQRPELLILEQRSMRDGIIEALGDEDFGFNDNGTAAFLLKVTRRGSSLDNSYSVLPKAKAPTKVETNGISTVKDLQVSALLTVAVQTKLRAEQIKKKVSSLTPILVNSG